MFQISDSRKTDTAWYRMGRGANSKLPTQERAKVTEVSRTTGARGERVVMKSGGRPRRGPLEHDGGPEVVITYSHLALQAGPWQDHEIAADVSGL